MYFSGGYNYKIFGKGKKLMHWYMTQVQNIPNLNFLYPEVYSYKGSANTAFVQFCINLG